LCALGGGGLDGVWEVERVDLEIGGWVGVREEDEEDEEDEEGCADGDAVSLARLSSCSFLESSGRCSE